MEKPTKSRRRRSIRNLRRASTGFNSPPAASAPYGSAWIDRDQETNLDNLVMSLSLLQANDGHDDNDNVDDHQGSELSGQRNQGSSPSSQLPHCGDNCGIFCTEQDQHGSENDRLSSSLTFRFNHDNVDHQVGESGGQRSQSSSFSKLSHCGQHATENDPFSSSYLTFHSGPDETSALLCGEELMFQQKSEDEGASESGKLTESFSFSPDMPVCWNTSEKCSDFPTSSYIANRTTSSSPTVSVNSKSSNTNLEMSNKDEYGNFTCEDSYDHLTETHQDKFCHQLDDLEVERTNDSSANLSLNFSPLSESDKTFDFLLVSMSHDSDLSLSSPGDRPNTPEHSPGLLFDNNAKQAIQFSYVSQEQSSIDDLLPPEMDAINDLTFSLNASDKSSPLERSYDDGILYTSSSSLSEEFPSVICENRGNDRDKRDTTDNDTRQVGEVNLDTASLPFDSCEVQNDQNFLDLVAAIVSDLEIVSIEEIDSGSGGATYTDSSHHDHSLIFTLDPREDHLSAQKKDDGVCSQQSQNTSDVNQMTKRTRRRTSRKFTREEISNSFLHNEEPSLPNDNPLPVSVRNCFPVTDSFDVLESDKENTESGMQEPLQLDSDPSLLMREKSSEGVQAVLSEVSNNQNQKQNAPRKKKRGRRSSGFHKGDDSILIENSGVHERSATDECIGQKHRDTHSPAVTDVGVGNETDRISPSCDLNEGESNASEHRSDSDQHSSNHKQDQNDIEESESAVPTRSLRARNNRKSWGDLSLRQTSGRKKQQRQSAAELESQQNVGGTEFNEMDISRLEQIYLQKKYTPVLSKTLETIKEAMGNGRNLFGKKSKRTIYFPENYRPSAVKHKMRIKKAGKNLKKRPGYCPIDHDDFQTKLLEIQDYIEGDELITLDDSDFIC